MRKELIRRIGAVLETLRDRGYEIEFDISLCEKQITFDRCHGLLIDEEDKRPAGGIFHFASDRLTFGIGHPQL